MQKGKYITTTLPYLNSNPHIGHLFEFVLADALARYFKHRGEPVFFNLGLDEHGLKIQRAAEEVGVSPKEYVDNLLYNWEDFLELIQVRSWDSFYRTSESDFHYWRVQTFWNEAVKRGDIYKKKYSGTYCVGCESFKTDRDLIDEPTGRQEVVPSDHPHFDPIVRPIQVCPDHPNLKLQKVEEENYFFKLSKYRNRLSSWAYKAVDFIEPKSKRAEFLKFIDNIEDISISRVKDTVSWGVSVPEDEDQTIYVWFDALLNYIFAVGYYPGEDFDGYEFDDLWNEFETIQICGPDNLKFQAVIFQGLLESAGIKHTNKLLVHGTILDANGRKMSKSVGNVVDPVDQVEKYGRAAVRYYALAGISTYTNSGWDEKRVVELYNSHLADDFGNLVARVSHLAGKVLEKFPDDPNIVLDYSLAKDDKWCVTFDKHIEDVILPLWNEYKVSEALDETNKVVKSLNKRINDEKPWEDLHAGWPVVLELHYALNKINDLYYPVFPHKSGAIRKSLKDCKKAIIFPKKELINQDQ